MSESLPTKRTLRFPNPGSEQANEFLERLRHSGMTITPGHTRTIRVLCWHTPEVPPTSYTLGIDDTVRLHWSDGRTVCVMPSGGIYA